MGASSSDWHTQASNIFCLSVRPSVRVRPQSRSNCTIAITVMIQKAEMGFETHFSIFPEKPHLRTRTTGPAPARSMRQGRLSHGRYPRTPIFAGLPDRSWFEKTLGGQHLVPLSSHSAFATRNQKARTVSLQTARHVMIIIAPSNSKSEKQTASGSLRLGLPESVRLGA